MGKHGGVTVERSSTEWWGWAAYAQLRYLLGCSEAKYGMGGLGSRCLARSNPGLAQEKAGSQFCVQAAVDCGLNRCRALQWSAATGWVGIAMLPARTCRGPRYVHWTSRQALDAQAVTK